MAYVVLAVAIGCTPQSQAQGVQNVVTQLKNIQPIIKDAENLATVYAQLDPALSAAILEYTKLADDNITSLLKIGNDYLARPSADNYQALLNGVDAFAASIDAKVLEAARISNPQTQQKILMLLALAATIIHIAVGILQQHASAKQLKTMPKLTGRVRFEQIKPYLDRAYARAELARMGYDADAALSAFGM
jgi:hypothetical protein